MTLAALLGGAAIGLVGCGIACFQWGKYRAKRDLLLLEKAQHQAAIDALARPVPTGGAVLDELQNGA